MLFNPSNRPPLIVGILLSIVCISCFNWLRVLDLKSDWRDSFPNGATEAMIEYLNGRPDRIIEETNQVEAIVRQADGHISKDKVLPDGSKYWVYYKNGGATYILFDDVGTVRYVFWLNDGREGIFHGWQFN